MKSGILYSGGKDSSLAAYLLDKLGFEVKLLTASFGINGDHKFARESAESLGFDFEILNLDEGLLEKIPEIIKRDGYPRNAINLIHKKALERAAEKYKILSDGTRRDDKTPVLNAGEIKSLESGLKVEYLPVLRGFGHKTINRMCERLFLVETGDSSKINKGDYEGELRTYLKNKGFNIKEIFPPHLQTRVISWRNSNVKSVESKKNQTSKSV
jgi:predicted subunit of tRNA(5-methylaminomethyl-2-thiouridylate) methyltransferase